MDSNALPKFLQRQQQHGTRAGSPKSSNATPPRPLDVEQKTSPTSSASAAAAAHYSALYGSQSSPVIQSSSGVASTAASPDRGREYDNIVAQRQIQQSLEPPLVDPETAKNLRSRTLMNEDDIRSALQQIEEETESTKDQLDNVRSTLQDRNRKAKKTIVDSYTNDNAAKLRTLPAQFQKIWESSLVETKAEVEALWAEEELRLLDWMEEIVFERARLKQSEVQMSAQHAKDIVEALKIPSQDQTDKFRQLTDKLLESETQRADIVVKLGQAQRTAQDLRRLLTSKGADEVRQAHEIVARLERDYEISQEERRKLSKIIAELQSKNAVLTAEKSKWLEQIQDENQQLSSLFKEARNAKEIMIRELNLIDRERRELEAERQTLRSNARRAAMRNAATGHGGALNKRAFASAGRMHKVIDKMREDLGNRQKEMEATFEAGKSALESTFAQDIKGGRTNKAKFDQLYRRLVPLALEADEGLRTDPGNFMGTYPAVNVKIDSLAVVLEERMKAQRLHLSESIARLEARWTETWSPFNSDDDLERAEERMMADVSEFIPRALAAGGSSPAAGAQIFPVVKSKATHATSEDVLDSASANAENEKLKAQIDQLTGDLERLRSVHRALHNNHSQLKKKMSKATKDTKQ